MTPRIAALLVLASLLTVAPAAEEPATPPPPTKEAAAQTALMAFWRATATGDADAFRFAVDLPLTLQDIDKDGAPGARTVVTAASWPEFRHAFPNTPQAAPEPQITELQLTWLGTGLCQAIYHLAGAAGGAGDAPTTRQSTQLVKVGDAWKVSVSTLPE